MLLFKYMLMPGRGNLFHLRRFLPPLVLAVRSHASDVTDYSYPATPNHSLHPQPGTPSHGAGDAPPRGPAAQAPEHEFRPPSASARHLALNRPQKPPPPPPQAAEASQAPAPLAPADYG